MPVAALLIFLCLYAVPGLQAQENSPELASTKEATAQRLQDVRTELSELGTDSPEQEHELLLELEATLIGHLEAIDYLAGVAREAKAAAEAVRSWDGPDQPPPYSVGFVDDLRARRQALVNAQAATESRVRIINQALEDTRVQLAEFQRARRRILEEAEYSTSAEGKRAAEAEARTLGLQSRIAVEDLARINLRRESQEVQKRALADRQRLLEFQISAAKGHVEFTRDELNRILQQVEDRRTALLQASKISVDAAEDIGTQITWKLEILEIEKEYWEALFTALNATRGVERKSAIALLHSLKGQMDDWVELVRLQLHHPGAGDAASIGTLTTEEDLRLVTSLDQRIEFSLEYFQEKGVSGLNLVDRVVNALLAIWNSELYLAEETSLIGGQKVTTVSAVTLGKLIRLAVILTMGWLILKFISRGVRLLLAGRSGVRQATADSTGRWIFVVGIILLIIFALNRVHIPFTAFAFLGGTLAIGIGFGAQTLVKNFISGIILKLERPFKVGDLVSVGPVKGRITNVGMRASGVRHFDGLDTLIPNSDLLENQVTNWTYGDTPMRGEIKVGVAYGSSLRDTSRALLSVAQEHGHVLDHPVPEVRLLEFGANAIIFQLLYWFNASEAQVEALPSDLRFMIGRSLDEYSIVIAFPQRDIHFSKDQPLRVEVSTPEKRPAPKLPDS